MIRLPAQGIVRNKMVVVAAAEFFCAPPAQQTHSPTMRPTTRKFGLFRDLIAGVIVVLPMSTPALGPRFHLRRPTKRKFDSHHGDPSMADAAVLEEEPLPRILPPDRVLLLTADEQVDSNSHSHHTRLQAPAVAVAVGKVVSKCAEEDSQGNQRVVHHKYVDILVHHCNRMYLRSKGSANAAE
jgi:hypothetical protein